jgi:hypothetical protein
MSKDFFQFKWFDELQVGDVFKFCPIIDSDIPSIFFTAFAKDEVNTKINATYGKELHRMDFANNTSREIMIFPNRKR